MTLSGRRHRRPLRGATALAPRLRRGFAKKPLASGTGCARELKIGAHYDIRRVGLEDWHRVAQTCALEAEQVVGWVTEMGKALPDEIGAARDQALKDGLARSIIVPLSQPLIAHARERLASLAPVTSRSPRLRKKSKTAP
jgi:hypothetical protein